MHQTAIQCYILYIKLLFIVTFCASNCYSVLHSVHQMLFSATFCASNCYSVLRSVHETVIQGLRTQLWHLRTHFWSFRLQFLTLRTHFWSLGAQFWPSILVANRQWMQFCSLRTQFWALWTHFWGLRTWFWHLRTFLKLQNSILGSQNSSGHEASGLVFAASVRLMFRRVGGEVKRKRMKRSRRACDLKLI